MSWCEAKRAAQDRQKWRAIVDDDDDDDDDDEILYQF